MITETAPWQHKDPTETSPLPRYRVLDTFGTAEEVDKRLNAVEKLGYRVLVIIPKSKLTAPRLLMELAPARSRKPLTAEEYAEFELIATGHA